MVLEFVLGFLILVTASYLGTTMALRGFFGRERYDAGFEIDRDGPSGSDGEPEADGTSRASDVSETDDVPRAAGVSDDAGENQ